MAAMGIAIVLPAFAGTTTFKYDGLGRVVEATYPDKTVVTYSYDDAGNRTQKQTFVVNPAIMISVTPSTGCERTGWGALGCSTASTASVSGGTGPYTYSWYVVNDPSGRATIAGSNNLGYPSSYRWYEEPTSMPIKFGVRVTDATGASNFQHFDVEFRWDY